MLTILWENSLKIEKFVNWLVHYALVQKFILFYLWKLSTPILVLLDPYQISTPSVIWTCQMRSAQPNIKTSFFLVHINRSEFKSNGLIFNARNIFPNQWIFLESGHGRKFPIRSFGKADVLQTLWEKRKQKLKFYSNISTVYLVIARRILKKIHLVNIIFP